MGSGAALRGAGACRAWAEVGSQESLWVYRLAGWGQRLLFPHPQQSTGVPAPASAPIHATIDASFRTRPVQHGGFLPAVRQLANVAALPGIVKVGGRRMTIAVRMLPMGGRRGGIRRGARGVYGRRIRCAVLRVAARGGNRCTSAKTDGLRTAHVAARRGTHLSPHWRKLTTS